MSDFGKILCLIEDGSGVSVSELAKGYPVLHIVNQFAKASIALHGAHVVDYTPNGSSPVIFTSDAAIYREGKAIRGGIPICWPWFGEHPDGLPSHGYARTRFWELEDVSCEERGTRMVFLLPRESGEALSAALEVIVGKELYIFLTTKNHSEEAQVFSEALHSYFCVSDARRVEVSGLERDRYIDTVGEEKECQQVGAIHFPDEVDRIYHSDSDVVIVDGARRARIKKQQSQSTIVWNPGVEKGGAMADLKKEEIAQFICVEAGNVREQGITLEPQETHTISLQIKVAP